MSDRAIWAKTMAQWITDCRKVTDGHAAIKGKMWSMTDQIAHANSEVSEVYQAIKDGEPRDRVLEEIADSVYAAMTMFHAYGATDAEIEGELRIALSKIAVRAKVYEVEA